ncbi:hypothetical protein CF336_g7089 [Tilletia laevis]|uniref:Uncharacterized protein n=1 Tax=Tilletia caries TaxID=13290 RepID=A0A177U4V6_9BASI|nr:hypothetical protein CF336_g7089 [Tilletia laevis]KAE8192815.1 hypothetical protein CF335_g5747 [Tilletia laevis]KAE8247935.1 hypothetical protein A4X03_0g6918 [Tilletia caries]
MSSRPGTYSWLLKETRRVNESISSSSVDGFGGSHDVDLLIQSGFPTPTDSTAFPADEDMTVLSAWHDIWGVEWKRFPLVDRALQGVARLAPDKLPLRPPVRRSDLAAASSMLDIDSNPLDAAVWACALVTFWAACRLGETTCPSQNFFNPARHVTRSAVSAIRLLPDDALALCFHLPWTKTTKRAGMTKVLSSQPDLFDPISALQHHLSFNTTPSTDSSMTSLFAYHVKAGRRWRLVPLSKD